MRRYLYCLLTLSLVLKVSVGAKGQTSITAEGQTQAAFEAARDLPLLDSLYTFAYLKHRVFRCVQLFRVPQPEKLRLLAMAAVADSLLLRVIVRLPENYRYLRYWITHPGLTEDSAMLHPDMRQPATSVCNGSDTAGYASFQTQLTDWRLQSQRQELNGAIRAAISYRDSAILHIVFYTADLFKAKRLAVANHDTAAYLRLLHYDPFRSLTEKTSSEMRWPMANTPEKKSFVQAAVRLADPSAFPPPKQQALPITLTINRYANLHSLASNCIFTTGALRTILKTNKQALRKIYCYLVEETFTAVPPVFCRYMHDTDSISPGALSTLNYFTLHLMQINAFGRIYPLPLFEDYFSFLQTLVYHRWYDMETYASFHDTYVTAILQQPSEYGFTSRRKGLDLADGTAPSPAIDARRRAMHLLPLEEALKE